MFTVFSFFVMFRSLSDKFSIKTVKNIQNYKKDKVSKLQGNGGAQHDICKPEERFGDSVIIN